MGSSNPLNSNSAPPPAPPGSWPAPPQPAPPAQPQYGYPQQMQNQGGQGWQPSEYSYPYPAAPARQGFPLWAWGLIVAGALIVLMGAGVLVAVLAGSGSGSSNNHELVRSNSHLGPPQWVQPGLRVTFYQAAASVAQSRFAWVEDPTGPWVEPKTGKRYRRTDEEGQGVGGGSGDGVSQIDVLAVEGNDVVYSLNLYTIDRSSNALAFLPPVISGGKTVGAAVDGAWIHPSVLAQLQDYNQAGLLVLRGDYALNGVTYKAIGFASASFASHMQYTYDTETGLLLSATTSTKGATSPLAPQGEAAPQGNTQLTITRFAGARQRSLPGINGANPGWLANTRELSYRGNYWQTNPIDPTSMSVNYPLEVNVSLGTGGATWSPYTARAQSQIAGSQPTESSGVTGGSGFYWFDTQALASLSPQQQLDRDPLTGETLEVASVDAGTVTIVSRLPGLETSATYHQSTGVLAGYRFSSSRTGTTIELGLQRGP